MSPLALFLLTGLLLAGLAPVLGKVFKSSLGLFAALIPATAFTWGLFSLKSLPIQSLYGWVPALGINLEFRLDHLGLLFWLLISGIGTLIFIYAGAYMSRETLPRLISLLSVFMVAMLGIASAGNTITLFLAWEATSIMSFLLIGFNNANPDARKSALQALSVTGLGGLILLAGLILLGIENNSYSFHTFTTASPLAITLIVIGCMTKSAQFPFHFWLPNAMAAPTPVSAYLHSATMVKAGVFLLAKFSPLFGPQPILAWIGGITLVWASILSLGERDLKRILAWSTVAALGMMVMLIGTGTPQAAEAVAYIILAHALYKGALFMLAGAIDLSTGTRDITRLGGLLKSPLFLPTLLALCSFAGLIPFAGFIKKELALAAYNLTDSLPFTIAIAISAVAGVIIAVTFVTKIFIKAPPGPLNPKPVAFGLWMPPLALSILGLLAGFFAEPLGHDFIQYVASDIHGESVKNHIALWHGLTPAFLTSTLAIVAGLIISPLWPKILSALEKTRSNFNIQNALQQVYSFTQTVAKSITHFYEKRSVREHLLLNFAAFLVLLVAVIIQSPLSIHMPAGPGILPHEIVILAFAAIASIAVIFVPNRMGSVAVLGIVGIAMTLTFVTFSAPDLALTQALIDVLTVILFVLVFSRLPRFHNRLSTRSKAVNFFVALAFGTAMTVVTLAVLSNPQLPSINHYFAENSYVLGHGRNVVNVIIVDFRALDTLGEVTVLCLAALGVHTLIRLRLGFNKGATTE